MGQFCSQGSITVWRAAPILQGETELPAGPEAHQAGGVEIIAGCWLIIKSDTPKKEGKKSFYVLNTGDLR